LPSWHLPCARAWFWPPEAHPSPPSATAPAGAPGRLPPAATCAVSEQAAWNVNLPSSGSYKVYARWTAGSNRPSNIAYQVYHKGGTANVYVNQQANGGTWNLLGTFNFPAGASQKIKLSCWASPDDVVIADAVRFVKQ